MKGRRTNYEIYWEILVFCRKPKSFTSIINRCDLNSKIGQQHIQFLMDKKFLLIETLEDKKCIQQQNKLKNILPYFHNYIEKCMITPQNLNYNEFL